MKSQRKFRNFVISPVLQFGISTQIISLVLLFAIIIALFTHYFLSDTLNLIIELTDIQEHVKEFFASKLTTYFFFLLVFLFIQFFLILSLVILHTHRFLGASFAIKRFVDEKLLNQEYKSRLILRKNDYLLGVADSLNQYCENKKNED